MEGLLIEDNAALQRYEARLDGKVVAYAEYRSISGAVMFTHTEVDEDMEGKGLGSKLIREALEDVKSKGPMAIFMCPFVAAFIRLLGRESVEASGDGLARAGRGFTKVSQQKKPWGKPTVIRRVRMLIERSSPNR
ncbi:MAG TPA: GNAT family N-acetyltransferase [Meiothermus sp.]|jgi:predicted GNAT family acetyltransferase|nr:GNAT family N-acetyltransferase [Meiothermus sp.]